MKRTLPMMLLAAIVLPITVAGADAKLPPIKTVKGVKPNRSIFKAAKRNKPLVIRSAKAAAAYFSKPALAKLKKQVDFKHQIVLVFAWKGSGQDRLNYSVAESFPEQIFFKHKRGRTRDLRSHVKIFVLRSNVKWRVR